MPEVSTLNWVDELAQRSGPVILAFAASLYFTAQARGWIYGKRYVELLRENIAKMERENKRLTARLEEKSK